MLGIKLLKKNRSFEELRSQTGLLLDWVNWPNVSAYKPNVRLKLGWKDKGLFLRFEVEEQQIKTTTNTLQARVAQDSCVEFFWSLDGGISYTNLELNATGSIYLAHRKVASGHKHYFSDRAVKTLQIRPSLEKYALLDLLNTTWTMELFIPAIFFGTEKLTQGFVFAGNFYKCGNSLDQAHYVSLFPIETEKPDFHAVQFFKGIRLE